MVARRCLKTSRAGASCRPEINKQSYDQYLNIDSRIRRSICPLPDSPENSLSETVRETGVARKLADCTARSLLPSRLIALFEAGTARYAQLFDTVVRAAIEESVMSLR